MSDMCFEDFDYDRHSDNCECEECRAELVESAQHIPQQTNGGEYPQICPNCGGKVELVNCVYACSKCNWWQYSSS